MIELNKIYNEDCINGLKNIDPNTIDLLFTDPPYKLTGGGRKNSMLRNNENENPFSTTGECFNYKTPEFKDWIPLIYPIMKDNSYIFIMTNDRNMRDIWDLCEESGFIFCELLVMNKTNAVPSSYFYKSCEFILMFRKGGYKKFYKFGHKNVFDVKLAKGKNKIHPTEKPTELIIPILEACSKINDIVLDPFAGSCNTLLSAYILNRKYIGFEIDEAYFKLANERIKNHETLKLENLVNK